MKNYTGFKPFIAISVVFMAFSAVSAASAAVYYDQLGQAHYYDTYEVPCGQYYPPAPCTSSNYGYNTSVAYGYQSGYSTTGASSYNARGNRQPVIFSAPVREAIDGHSYVAGINASDPDHDQITYALVSGPSGMYIDSNTGLLHWNSTSGKSGKSFPVTVSATDGRSAPVTQSFTLSVRSYGGGSSSNSSGSSSYTGSIFGSLFGSKTPKGIVISNVNVVSGPKDINDTTEQNCNVYVSWSTNVATAGQVVYGPTSQQSLENYSYPQSAPEGNAYAKEHQVKLGCLGNATAFFRIVAFSSTDRVASSEYTIFPIKIATQIPGSVSYAGNIAAVTESSGSSIWGQILKFIFHPVVIIVLLIAGIWYAVLRVLGRLNSKAARHKEAQAAAAATHSAPVATNGHATSHEIPMLSVPH